MGSTLFGLIYDSRSSEKKAKLFWSLILTFPEARERGKSKSSWVGLRDGFFLVRAGDSLYGFWAGIE